MNGLNYILNVYIISDKRTEIIGMLLMSDGQMTENEVLYLGTQEATGWPNLSSHEYLLITWNSFRYSEGSYMQILVGRDKFKK